LIELISSYFIVIVVSMFLVFSIIEVVAPLNKVHQGLTFRWFTNIMLTICVLLVLKLAGPALAVISATFAEYLGIGIFNHVELSQPLVMLLGLIIIDFKQYWFHRLMHYFDFLWRFHKVHHSDTEIDLTTGFRFHSVEAILSSLSDLMLIAVFGIPVEVLLVNYLLVYLGNFFTHGNYYLPPTMDRYLKWVLITPSLHHLHHAMDKRAANSNFGVDFSFWDRIFGSYLDKHPQEDRFSEVSGYVYGLREYREPGKLNLLLLMLMPFRSESGDQSETAVDS
jgi:sterol desaturase/sphingolipid hydroxylase (fatty acid hydroxylase superfamily)